jgi:hypothetical protein
MKKTLALLAIIALVLTGCATTPTVPTTSDDSTVNQAQVFVTGAQWVSAVADGVVLTGCTLGKIKPVTCAAYQEARALLDQQLATITALIQGKASPEDLKQAIVAAMVTYAKIEAAYQGKV